MRKHYTYKNGTVCVVFENDISGIQKATELFLQRVLKEEIIRNGNRNTPKNFGEE